MLIPRLISFGLALVVLTISGRAAQAQTPVTTCGSVVDNGYLTGDLDCRGIEGQEFPVMIHPKGSLDLRGFTLSVGEYSVYCGTVETAPGGETYISVHGKCTISNGVIRDSAGPGITAEKLVMTNVSVLDSAGRGIQGVSERRGGSRFDLIGSTVSGSGDFAVLTDTLVLRGSTITGNARGALARGARLRDSSATGNGTGPSCGTGCADLRDHAKTAPHELDV